jgi:hypothetical protein
MDNDCNYIVVALEDQENTIFNCPSDTFSYRSIFFGLCNARATFWICIMSIFSDHVERII